MESYKATLTPIHEPHMSRKDKDYPLNFGWDEAFLQSFLLNNKDEQAVTKFVKQFLK